MGLKNINKNKRRYERNKISIYSNSICNEFQGFGIRKSGKTSYHNNNNNEILISKQKRGYGEIGRRYGLNWIEPWYGNLLNDNFQIQRNPGINNG